MNKYSIEVLHSPNLVIFWLKCLGFFPPGSPLVGNKHITETQIISDLAGIELGRMLHVSFMISLKYVCTLLPPHCFSIVNFPNLNFRILDFHAFRELKGHLVWWLPNRLVTVIIQGAFRKHISTYPWVIRKDTLGW